MDRLEHLMELVIADHVKFADEHNKLLTSQVLLTDGLDKLGKFVATSVRELTSKRVREEFSRTARTASRAKASNSRPLRSLSRN